MGFAEVVPLARHPFLVAGEAGGGRRRPLAFAHQGGAGEAPGNSMAAFSRAVGMGFRFLETDVRVTLDGELVVCHDATLDRTTDAVGAVAALPWARVARARLRGCGEPVPLFAEVLAAFPSVRFNVDVKAPGAAEALVRVVREAAAWDRVCVASFSEARLARARALAGPRLATSLGQRAVAGVRLAGLRLPGGLGVPSVVARWWGGVAVRRAVCVQVPEFFRGLRVVDGCFVRAAHERGLQVHVWTVDDPVAMGRLLDVGVDGLMTDRPSVLRRVLSGRGLWPTW